MSHLAKLPLNRLQSFRICQQVTQEPKCCRTNITLEKKKHKLLWGCHESFSYRQGGCRVQQTWWINLQSWYLTSVRFPINHKEPWNCLSNSCHTCGKSEKSNTSLHASGTRAATIWFVSQLTALGAVTVYLKRKAIRDTASIPSHTHQSREVTSQTESDMIKGNKRNDEG